MTWFSNKDNRTFIQKITGKLLSCGPIPNHIAIIMDGNRRFAKQNKVEKIKGHDKGFEKLAEVLLWCNKLNIKEVTVYAFSIENFHRAKEEVEQLFNLAREKFEKLLEEKDKLKEFDVCIRMIGDLSLMPNDLQQTMSKIMEITKQNKTCFLNICCAYGSREEMTSACREICEGIKQGVLNIDDINEELVEKCLYTNKSSKVDLLIRTSGEVRLSDFLLWQSTNSTLAFESSLWPQFCIWDFYSAIVKYQLNFNEKTDGVASDNQIYEDRVNLFISNLNSKREENISNLSNMRDKMNS